MRRKITGLFGGLLFLTGMFWLNLVPAAAEDNTLIISSVEDWKVFAEKCRTDIYSQGLNVSLGDDLDLTELPDPAVPVFGGTFEGNGHVIRGFSYTESGTVQGLFRTLESTAAVRNLVVEVSVMPRGEQKTIGGLAGDNFGTLEGCTVEGEVMGSTDVGGLVGINQETGQIINCTNRASVQATYRVGGIAGSNLGTITGCGNEGEINREADESSTNVGGITGRNQRKIENCLNYGDVGYPHTGYNVGGIAGIQTGFLNLCENHGSVRGRRDVGGILGQLDPSFKVEYAANQLSVLDGQIGELSESLNTAVHGLNDYIGGAAEGAGDILEEMQSFTTGFHGRAGDLISNVTWFSDVSNELESLRSELDQMTEISISPELEQAVNEAKDILEQLEYAGTDEWPGLMSRLLDTLLDVKEQLPDYSTALGAADKIMDSFSALSAAAGSGLARTASDIKNLMEETRDELNALIEHAASFLSSVPSSGDEVVNEVEQLTDRLGDVRETITDMSGGTTNVTEDLSELAAGEEDGSVLSAKNYGMVTADYNAGGIAGTIARDSVGNQEESEESAGLSDYLFSDSTTYIKATLYGCRNHGDISTKYDQCGGIAGYGRYGAVIESQNSGSVTAGSSYAGGIAGRFQGILIRSHSAGHISGKSYVGGIGGSVSTVRECLCISELDGRENNVGGIAGEVSQSAQENYFLENGKGGIDGINRSGKAMPLGQEEMYGRPDLPEVFQKMEVTFVKDGETIRSDKIDYGGSIEELPQVEKRGEQYWVWDEFERECVTYSQTVEGEYKNPVTTLASRGGETELLVQGTFYPGQTLVVTPWEKQDIWPDGKPLSSGIVCVSDYDEVLEVRVRCERNGSLYLQTEDGLKKSKYTRDGSYVVFQAANDSGFLILEKQESFRWWIIAAGGAVLLILAAVIWHHRKKGKQTGGK